uniref:Cytochrome P450, family 27, subfamily C, polypeptide 1 n=1 Tax=Callorhinchus milii TaxID=7868 RepID=A0A4W3H3M3_CALMI
QTEPVIAGLRVGRRARRGLSLLSDTTTSTPTIRDGDGDLHRPGLLSSCTERQGFLKEGFVVPMIRVDNFACIQHLCVCLGALNTDSKLCVCLKHTQQYGKIFKSRFGPQFVVSIADQDMVAQVLRAEGRAPQRANMESWQEYRETRGRATGLISAEGEEWFKMRSTLKQQIMKPTDVAVYSKGMTDVVSDLITRMKEVKSRTGPFQTISHVNNLFFRFAMEGVATILFESRLGCLENEIPEETQEYIRALELMFSMFKTTMYAGTIPKWLRPFIPKPWDEFCRFTTSRGSTGSPRPPRGSS